jgi:hypothetical protein
MTKYDLFIAGRWRNADNIKPVLDMVRSNGSSAYCFIENDYKGEVVELGMDNDPHIFMDQLEALDQNHPLIRKIFDIDITAERESECFLLVLPAGIAGHVEAGAATVWARSATPLASLKRLRRYTASLMRFSPTYQLSRLGSKVLSTSTKGSPTIYV